MSGDDGTLLVIAQIALGLIGFGAIVVALQPRSLSEWSIIERAGFWALINGGLFIVAFSLVPKIVFSLTLDETLTWQVSSGLYFLWQGAFVILNITIGRSISSLSGSNKYRFLLILIYSFVAVLCLLNMTGIFFKPQIGVYLLCLFINFGLACMHFVSLLRILSQSSGGE